MQQSLCEDESEFKLLANVLFILFIFNLSAQSHDMSMNEVFVLVTFKIQDQSTP